MEKITITLVQDDTNDMFKGLTVSQGDKYADGLGYDEMLGLVAALTMPEPRPTLQWMKTAEQHAALRKRLEELSKDNDDIIITKN
jgi:hypothetical protein